MRQILVDYARTRGALKRDGGLRIDIDALANLPMGNDDRLLGLHDALEALSQIDERQAKIVDMKFFGGLSTEEIAESLHVSAETVLRDWKLAKLWLLRELSEKESL